MVSLTEIVKRQAESEMRFRESYKFHFGHVKFDTSRTHAEEEARGHLDIQI